jgi:hypothetical protein
MEAQQAAASVPIMPVTLLATIPSSMSVSVTISVGEKPGISPKQRQISQPRRPVCVETRPKRIGGADFHTNGAFFAIVASTKIPPYQQHRLEVATLRPLARNVLGDGGDE